MHPADPRLSLVRSQPDYEVFSLGKYMFRPATVLFPQQIEIHSLIYDNHYHEIGKDVNFVGVRLNHYWTLSRHFWQMKIERGSPVDGGWRKDWAQFERKNSNMSLVNLELKYLVSEGYEEQRLRHVGEE